MQALGELYNFCEDVTDGTKQDYPGLGEHLSTEVDFTSWDRFHTASDMIAAGYADFKGYATIFSCTKYISETDTWIVFTPIFNEKSYGSNGILPFSQLKAIESQPNAIPPKSLIMASFNGTNGQQRAECYAEAVHQIGALWYQADSRYTLSMDEDTRRIVTKGRRILESLSNIPVNALRNGIHEDLIRDLVDLGAEYDEKKIGDYNLVPYYLDVLEQASQDNQEYKILKESDGLLHVRLECNAVLNKEIKVENLLSKILLTGRSMLKRSDDNKYEPLIGRPDPYPVTVISQRNCLGRSNNRSYDELPSGFQASLIDEADNYTTNDIYIMDDGESYKNPSARIEPITIEYVTNKNQMALLVKYNLACRLYQLETYSRTVGMIGHSMSLGDTVLLQDDTLLVGTDNGGRIIELLEDDDKIYGFTTDEPAQYLGKIENGLCTQGCTIVQPSEYGNSRCVTLRFATPDYAVIVNNKSYRMKKGLTNLFLLDTPIFKNTNLENAQLENGDFYFVHPELDNLVVFGNVGAITMKAIIMSIKPKDGDKFDLSLVPYNEDLYNSGSGYPVFSNNMTNKPADNFDFNFNVTYEDLKETTAGTEVMVQEKITAALKNIYTNQIVTLYKRSSEKLKTTGITSNLIYDFSKGESSWESEAGSNGWVTDIGSTTGDSKLYITTAVAVAQGDPVATIIPEKWATPALQSENGINTATIYLYQRSSSTTNPPAITLVYNFKSRTLRIKEDDEITVRSVGFDGWLTSIPGGTEPLYVITATVASSEEEDDILPSEWSQPSEMAKNGGYQKYVFLIDDFGLTDDELYGSDKWTDNPGNVPEGKCMYMATVWVEG